MNAPLARPHAAGILTGWREIEDYVVPSAAARLSRSAVDHLIALGFLAPLSRGPARQIRISAVDLDVAHRALGDARILGRERFGRHHRGGLSDRVARVAWLEQQEAIAARAGLPPPHCRVRRALDAEAARRQLGLFGEPVNAEEDDEEGGEK